ncbi:efflux RND transporter periplasmic adaptor subunit [Akkermansia sp.]|uniref:efflux RND transporter periplasmic adaptor subunit n=1 Tax=Akkermansia sp. TaxID=1872421 RepID=UPI0039966F95
MYNKPLTIAATTILLCSPVIILSSCEKKDAGAGQPQALVPDVQVTKLVTEDVPIKAIWIGNLRGTEDAEIRSQVTGYLLSKDYKDGAYVKKGQTLFQIDPRPFQATLEQAQGRLEQYEATLKKYQLDVERYTPLVKSGSVSRKQLDDALQQVQETEAAIATAKAQVDQARINLKFTTITAPISGLAGLATPSIGNLLTPSSPTPLTTISPLTPSAWTSPQRKDFLDSMDEIPVKRDQIQRHPSQRHPLPQQGYPWPDRMWTPRRPPSTSSATFPTRI